MRPAVHRATERPQAPPLAPAGRGFTLVEVLVAMTIMAVIAAIGWQGVSGMARAREYGTSVTERTLRLAALVNQFELDLQAVYDSTQVPGLQFDGASLRLARRSDGGVQVVVWSLREGVWQRWAGAPTTRQQDLAQAWLASQQLQGREPGQLRLLDGVTDWQVQFFRGQGWSNAQSSGDLLAAATPARPASAATAASAASAAGGAGAPADNPPAAAVRQRTQLPTGVRLLVGLPEGRLTRDVLMPPQMP